jgi:hypothetical protein
LRAGTLRTLISNEDNEINDPITPNQQRQQQRRPLRRAHIEAASVGISPSPPRRVNSASPSEHRLTHDFEESTDLATTIYKSSPEDPRRPHRALRRSKNRESAILYALEEALRYPNPFTSDIVEENASMADLAGGGQPTSAGNARPGRTQMPGTTGSPNIRGPRDIMRERNAREQRRREETERRDIERLHAEEEARLVEQERRRSAERRIAAAAGAATQGGQQRSEGVQRTSGGTAGPRVPDNLQRPANATSGERPEDAPLQGVGRGGRAVGGGEPAASRARVPQPQQRIAPPPESSRARPAQSATAASSDPQPAQPAPGPSATRSSFPHAFERWETLSAHWEGLTSFWLRRLEENSNEINREPISQQLSRQVTDLSAAGANLFHAVVELQRLRASSERKFQRWFFETRAEQERAQEIQAMTAASLEQERAERAAAIKEAVENERLRHTSDKKLTEMKRELQIAKEEAKRAWEELGRREQEERDRTASLREGHPTVVGGVQVVPMMQGVPSRHGSNQATDQPVQEPEGHADDSDVAYQQYSRSQRADPVDPFVEQDITPTRAGRSTRQQEFTQAPAVQPTASPFYQQPGTSVHPVDPTNRSDHNQSIQSSALSESEYLIGNDGRYVLDPEGKRIPYPKSGALPFDEDDDDDYNVSHELERERQHLQDYGRAPVSVSGVEYGGGRLAPPTGHPATSADYSGQGYAPEWEIATQHHHPTRLSDVIEEDERSRTSTNQGSRRE